MIEGLKMDIAQCSLAEITAYLLIFSVQVICIGTYIEKKKITRDYLRLIRCDSIHRWWNHFCFRLVCFIFLSEGIYCTLAYVLEYVARRAIVVDIYAVILWINGFITIGLIQAVFMHLRAGEKLVFSVILCIELLSVFGRQLFGEYADHLPGCYLMIKRSGLFEEGGFQWTIVCVAECFIDWMLVHWGYRFCIKREDATRWKR